MNIIIFWIYNHNDRAHIAPSKEKCVVLFARGLPSTDVMRLRGIRIGDQHYVNGYHQKHHFFSV